MTAEVWEGHGAVTPSCSWHSDLFTKPQEELKYKTRNTEKGDTTQGTHRVHWALGHGLVGKGAYHQVEDLSINP